MNTATFQESLLDNVAMVALIAAAALTVLAQVAVVLL